MLNELNIQQDIMAHSPDTVQITEVQFLPEAAAEAIANPAGDGQNPQASGRPGQTQHSLICATEWEQNKKEKEKKISHK